MTAKSCDFLIVGAGIAGASAAYELARLGRVVLLEREERAGYHSTGRSAALYAESYGNFVVRAITSASREFYHAPPAGFAEHPLLRPRGTMLIARADQREALDAALADIRRTLPTLVKIDGARARELCPAIGPDIVAGIHVPDDKDMDVDAIHQGFLRGARRAGADLVVDAEVLSLRREGARWLARTKAGDFAAPIVVNAAGAWCDAVAGLAGIAPIGLVPKRRTAFVFPAPEGASVEAWPAVIDVAETFYFKPEAGTILGSPANEDPVEPHDVQPEDLDVAIAVDRIESATSLKVRRVISKWAGLRSFVPDKTLVTGFEPDAAGFFWCAGQGGYGIQTAPAMGRIVAHLATGRGLPTDVAARGVREADLSPARFRHRQEGQT
jgi:D-arginine dehydrogenase